MPAAIMNTLDNVTGEHIKKIRPYYVLVIIFILIIIIIYSERIMQIQNDIFYVTQICILTIISFITILSIIVNNIDYGTNKYLDAFSNTFNSVSSKNFIAVTSLVLFVIFIYEVPKYDNNDPNPGIDTALFGHNKYISNKLLGLLIIMFFTLYVSVTIYLTTID